ncbi:MAG: glutamine--tRNA ligase/YqeY domain fusion protein [Syntrophomonadaceae bacterium]|nr:glutamine--tRNA ligase/YqeY domain fusion protein [Syntrophomonadaceae bacterium]
MEKPDGEIKEPDKRDIEPGHNFIQNIVNTDLLNDVYGGRIRTRFPPEPNGYLHIGHAKSICLNFGLALHNGGLCNLRFDDTNPSKEDTEFVDSIKEDVEWLGFSWDERLFYASDYFEWLYEYALKLIKAGKAFVCELSAREIRDTRGTLTEPGQESPYRQRGVEENLRLFQEMKEGRYEDGSKVLRAKIDMASPNINLRDPVLYRILHAAHHRTGDGWCIYPMYDYAHPLSDAFEGVTHSICTMEFEDHRPLYDWVLAALPKEEYPCEVTVIPKQIEFARLNLTHTVMSKRKLRALVEEKIVTGWDDPRMPTISGLRRRGYTPEAIRDFCERIGVAKRNSMVDIALLEHCIRETLNKTAPRIMAVLRPLKIVITNYPENSVEWLATENNPENPDMGYRQVPFAREIYIEQEDFMENPPKKFFRLRPDGEVRLKSAYIIKCEQVIKNEKGEVTELRCTYDPDSKSGGPASGRKVKGTSHWVSAAHALDAEVRLYEHLFLAEEPDTELENGGDVKDLINKEALRVIASAKIEPGVAEMKSRRCQFLRQGYFYLEPRGEGTAELVFNRIVSLKDSWSKARKNANQQ